MGHRVWVWVCVCLIIGLFTTEVLLGAATPLAVSPGKADVSASIDGRCPTFSWGLEPNVRGYELVVYRIDEAGEASQLALRKRFRSGVASWTPSLDACLERGGRYAWSVRSVLRKSTTDWTPPLFFEIPAEASTVELEQALALLRRHLDRGVQEGVTEALAPARKAPAGSMSADASRASVPSLIVDPQLTVDGQISADMYLGSGSGLTNLDPDQITSGTAGIDVTGTAANVTGVVSVSHGGTGATSANQACTNLGAASAADLVVHGSSTTAHHDPADVLPIGTIVIWTGDVVPDGWVLCDGQSFADREGVTRSTPDLRGRFVMGFFDDPDDDHDHALRSNGGNWSHDHHIASHNHQFYWSGSTPAVGNDERSGTWLADSNYWATGGHTHSLVINQETHYSGSLYTTYSSTQEKLPRYYAVAYIMKK